MISVESICTGSMSSPSPSALMTQEIDPTIKIYRAVGGTKILQNVTSCSTWKQHAHPYLARQLSTEYHRQSSEGYSMKVDLSVEMRVIENKKSIETQELDRFGPSARRNTLLLWSVGLYWL